MYDQHKNGEILPFPKHRHEFLHVDRQNEELEEQFDGTLGEVSSKSMAAITATHESEEL